MNQKDKEICVFLRWKLQWEWLTVLNTVKNNYNSRYLKPGRHIMGILRRQKCIAFSFIAILKTQSPKVWLGHSTVRANEVLRLLHILCFKNRKERPIENNTNNNVLCLSGDTIESVITTSWSHLQQAHNKKCTNHLFSRNQCNMSFFTTK